jgi:hypothetical protein
MKKIREITIALVALLTLGLVLAVFVWLESSKRIDFALNLFSTGLGISATVLIIDRLIEYRENAQRKPSQNVIYSRLFKITTDVISQPIPGNVAFLLLDPDGYMFGRCKVPACINASQLQHKMPAMFSEIHRDLTERKRVGTSDLSKARQRLASIIDGSSFLLEVDLLNLLLQMDNSIEDAIDVGESSFLRLDTDKENPFLMLYSLYLIEMLEEALKVRLWLEKVADSRISGEVEKLPSAFERQKRLLEQSKLFAEKALPEELKQELEDSIRSLVSNASRPNKDSLP